MQKLTDELISDWGISDIKFSRSHRGRVWINHDLKTACLGIPKCASSSVRNQFKLTELAYVQDVPDDYFLFAIIRNPADRVISAYIEVVQACHHYPKGRFHFDLEISKEQISFLDNLMQNPDEYERFSMYLNQIQYEWGFFELHGVPQIIYLTDNENKTFPNLNNIYKLNNLSPLEAILGAKVITQNQSENFGLKHKLRAFVKEDADIRHQIEELYKCDFKLWNLSDSSQLTLPEFTSQADVS